MARRVREVMSPRPAVLPLDAPVTEAARMMRDRDIGGVLVTRGERLCGLLTDRDIVLRAIATGRDPAGTRLGDVCSADLITIGPDDDIAAADRMMRERSVRRLPVIEQGRPVGIVSSSDLPPEDG